MSRYELHRLLFDLKMQDELVAAMRADPDDVLARYDLTEDASTETAMAETYAIGRGRRVPRVIEPRHGH